MGVITEIKEGKNKNRVNVYVDGEFCVALDSFVCYKLFLKVGREITAEKLEEIGLEEERESALKKGIAYVSRYRVTEKRAKEYLADKGYSRAVVEEVMEKLKKYSFVGDEKYARDFTASKLKTKGGKAIKMQLAQKGVSADIIGEIEVSKEDELESCKKQGEKYMRRKEKTRENFAKLFQNLAGKGYDYAVINEVIGMLKEDGNDEDWV